LALHLALVGVFLLLVGQLYHMQILEGSSYVQQAKDNRERLITLNATRGVIYDRNGQRLVVNNPSYAIAVTPADVPGVNCGTGQLRGAQVFTDVARILNTAPQTLGISASSLVTVSDVIAVTPRDLPDDKVGEVA